MIFISSRATVLNFRYMLASSREVQKIPMPRWQPRPIKSESLRVASRLQFYVEAF